MTAQVRPSTGGAGGDHPDSDHAGLTTVIAGLATEVGRATAAENTKVDKATLDAQSVLGAVVDNSPVALPVPVSHLVGRKETGDVGALTVAEVLALLAIYTSAQTDSAISAAIAGVIDSAPGAIDTLNELAAALGDDPNFAATVTNALSLRATIASLDTHTLSGVHTAPQPPIIGATATTAVAGNDAKLTDDRTPLNASVTPAKFAASAIDPAAGVAGARTLGAGAQQAAPGNVLATQDEVIGVALGDETTAITTGTAKVTMRMPFAMTLTAVRASLTTASSSGIPTVDINEGGATILSTKLTIDAGEKTSTTAATPAVISDTTLADDAEVTFDVDVAGTGAAGLKVWLIGRRA